ncbi:unnamed protein product, partial [Rotaria sordida]
KKRANSLTRASSNNDSLSDDSDINLYEMRVPIGKTYDTSDISVQLEGPKILIHCYTIEATDKRGNYRRHEFKTELLVPDVVDDESIVVQFFVFFLFLPMPMVDIYLPQLLVHLQLNKQQ